MGTVNMMVCQTHHRANVPKYPVRFRWGVNGLWRARLGGSGDVAAQKWTRGQQEPAIPSLSLLTPLTHL